MVELLIEDNLYPFLYAFTCRRNKACRLITVSCHTLSYGNLFRETASFLPLQTTDEYFRTTASSALHNLVAFIITGIIVARYCSAENV